VTLSDFTSAKIDAASTLNLGVSPAFSFSPRPGISGLGKPPGYRGLFALPIGVASPNSILPVTFLAPALRLFAG
jgi:hypothetical protein